MNSDTTQSPARCVQPACSAHWAIVLQAGLIPIRKRLPPGAAKQVTFLHELASAYPSGLIAVIDTCGAVDAKGGLEMAIWSPAEVAAMAGLDWQNAESIHPETKPTDHE